MISFRTSIKSYIFALNFVEPYIYNIYMEDRELLLKKIPEFDRLAFTVLAIEASAQKMGISPSEMRRRLDNVWLIKKLDRFCRRLTQIWADFYIMTVIKVLDSIIENIVFTLY